jgi:hypothetical protein
MVSRQLFLHEDASLPKQLFFYARFTIVDSSHVWMLIMGYINWLRRETLFD